MSIRSAHIILLLALAWLLTGCSTTRYVPEGDFLYKGASVKVNSKEVKREEERQLSEELESILRPRPNKEFLGIPFKLLIYSFWGTPGKYNGLGNWISRNAGEEPVLFSDVRVDFQKDLLINRMENRGYFRSSLEMDSTVNGRKIKLKYSADPGRQYLIDTVYFPKDSSILGTAIRENADKTFLEKDEPFDLDVIKAERERLNARLKEQGFYYFSADDILVLVDSTEETYFVDLKVTIKQSTPVRAQEKFYIDNIYIYPFRTLTQDTVSGDSAVIYKDFRIYDPDGIFRPRIFDQALFFEKGDIYNRTDHNRSLNRLIDLGVFKYVENKFEEKGDSLLDAYYYLTPFKKKSFRLDLTGRSTSTNFAGAEANFSWQNRNAMRGAENLRINVYGGTDVQISGINKGNNLYRFGTEVNLNIPRFITPFPVQSPSAFIPRTRISAGYDKINRADSYVLNSFRTSFGYLWKENIKKEHQLTVFSVNYIQPSNITPQYEMRLMEDPTLANAIQKQFIIGPQYNYNFTNTIEQNRKHTFYFNGNIDLSGNILGLASGADVSTGETKEILGAVYAQYVRLETDFRHYIDLGRGSAFASRIFAGYGYAYGNSMALPFVKQFYSGGSSSIRAFRARSLGPGTYLAEGIGEDDFIVADQTGDIKLELNFEYRPKISGIMNGALFVDAGNIWLLRDDPMREGEQFDTSDFISEIAVGVGFGLRFDFSFFILRGDLAFPVRKPWLPEGDRWVFDEISPGDPSWRKENLVLNLAIDYPF